MFKFEFDLGDLTEEARPTSQNAQSKETQPSLNANKEKLADIGGEGPCVVIPLDKLIDQLPPFITYSNLKINSRLSVYKRELYDAKYQTIVNLAAEEEEEDEAADESQEKGSKDKGVSKQQTLESLQSTSDLIPGIYEGGFKTWECSIDLATHLDPVIDKLKTIFTRRDDQIRCAVEQDGNPLEQGTFRILEIGCGTAVPTASLCFQLFVYLLNRDRSTTLHSSSISNNQLKAPILEIILQDFNSDVLKLLTFPNILLAFYRATLVAGKDKENTSLESRDNTREQTDEETNGENTIEEDLEITDELKTEFEIFLRSHGIQLTFIYGPWSTFKLPPIAPDRTSPFLVTDCERGSVKGCEAIISSETLYSVESLPSLINVILSSKITYCHRPQDEEASKDDSTILIASKSIYFGVGGGTHSFINSIEKTHNGVVSLIDLHHSDQSPLASNGVSRVLMEIKFLA
ncbi:hypothetical protein PCANC_24745 [Puccinia coronata f. sp. avenae]|uniref:protein-histidine N-methyltransferase n=1 Tax=Puccinia coronata f. sp. avenae TaxID=200324 RepID=A0A2N5TWU6_9BASI|nr:hypothetical protein PCANC_24745 [Puccinia coronata f. sp. avenae]PLW35859.1 hypothetical protein PCASD_14435 [Puccinia coronata f. sp. avenae]